MLNKKQINELKCGDILKHSLGIIVSCVKVTTHERKKGEKKESIRMIKCRHLDKNNMFHVFEFFPEELEWIQQV